MKSSIVMRPLAFIVGCALLIAAVLFFLAGIAYGTAIGGTALGGLFLWYSLRRRKIEPSEPEP